MVNKTKVLVIDDDVNICELIRLYLEKDGYEVLTVYNGKNGAGSFSRIHSKHGRAGYNASWRRRMAGLQGNQKNKQYTDNHAHRQG